METIQFTTVIGADGIIRPPAGVALPEGDWEITVKPARKHESSGKPSMQWLLDLAEKIEREGPDLPEDMAENHDYYAHGKPKS